MPQQVETQPQEQTFDDYVSTRRSKAASPEEVAQETEESEAPAEEAETAADTESEEEPQESEEEKPKTKSKGGFQKRIDKLTRKIYELEGELERRGSLAGNSAATEPAKSKAKAKPDINTFQGTVAEYEEALAEWIVETKLAEAENKRKQQAEEERTKSAFDSYNRKVAAARAEHDDWDEVVGNPDVKIPQVVQVAVIEMDNGPDVAYYLGQNPEICDELMEMSPVRAVATIGAIADSLADDEPSSPPPKRKSNAPEPITPVGGSAKSARPLSEINDADEYMKKRRAQIREARRR